METNETGPRPHGTDDTGYWTTIGIAAASFAGLLNVINAKLSGDCAEWAMWAFAFALPTSLFGAIVNRRRSEYGVGCLSALIPAAGLVAVFCGVGFMIACQSRIAAVVFGVAAIPCAILAASTWRGRAKR